MTQRLILTEEEKRNIQKMYGMINEQAEVGCVNTAKTPEEKDNVLRDAISRVKSEGFKEVELFNIYREKLPSYFTDSENARKDPGVYCIWHYSGIIAVYTDYDRNDLLGYVAVNGKPNKTCDLGKQIFDGGLIDKYLCNDINIDRDKSKYFIKN